MAFTIYTNINLKKLADSVCCPRKKKTDVTTITMLRSSNVLFRGRSIKFDFHIIFMIIVLVISC